MADNNLEEEDSLMGQESDLDEFKPDEAMEIEPDFGDETLQSWGLFKYFEECSREQYLEDVARETEKWKLRIDQEVYTMEKANMIKAFNL